MPVYTGMHKPSVLEWSRDAPLFFITKDVTEKKDCFRLGLQMLSSLVKQ